MKPKFILLIIIYIIFIALGLPDALLGSSWTKIRLELNVPLAFLGFITTMVYMMTIISTSNGARLLRKFQTKVIVIVSVLLTAIGLFGMSLVNDYYLLVLFAIPLGIGQGAIDMSLNHYMSVHYEAKHMSFLHAFYGIGVMVGPLVMSLTLQNESWRMGFQVVAGLLFIIAFLVMSYHRLWFQETDVHQNEYHEKTPIKIVFKIPGVLESILIFLFYVNAESLAGAWIASYMFLEKGINVSLAALMTFMFYLGLTSGRLLSGLFHIISPQKQITYGLIIILIGTSLLLLPISEMDLLIPSVILMGLGAGPIYPNMMFLNGRRFQKKQLSSIISIQMAIGYMGFGILTPLYGILMNQIGMSLYPLFIVIIIIIIFYLHHQIQHKTENKIEI